MLGRRQRDWVMTIAVAGSLVGFAAGQVTTAPPVGASSPPPAATTLLPPGATAGATSVQQFGATGAGTGDDTAAFVAAMAAALASPARYQDGPAGAPQAVVYVPPGTYRLFDLAMPSNVRLEVDAGAVLEQAPYPSSPLPPKTALIVWDAPIDGPALTNVSIVGVGTGSPDVKSLAQPVPDGWDVTGSFTFDLDPATTGADPYIRGIDMVNVDGFLVQNLFAIQNNTAPVPGAASTLPTSRRPVMTLRSSNLSPIGGPFYDPHDGAIRNVYEVGAPRGFGPDQVNSGHNLSFEHLYSRGGTTLRLETDNAHARFGGEIAGLTADDITGVDCNRAVSFAPHDQINRDVHVTNVVAIACYQGLNESIDEQIPITRRGAFLDSSVTTVSVSAGDDAQTPTTQGWAYEPSYQAYGRDGRATWAVLVTGATCTHPFTQRPDRILTPAGFMRPYCSP